MSSGPSFLQGEAKKKKKKKYKSGNSAAESLFCQLLVLENP